MISGFEERRKIVEAAAKSSPGNTDELLRFYRRYGSRLRGSGPTLPQESASQPPAASSSSVELQTEGGSQGISQSRKVDTPVQTASAESKLEGVLADIRNIKQHIIDSSPESMRRPPKPSVKDTLSTAFSPQTMNRAMHNKQADRASSPLRQPVQKSSSASELHYRTPAEPSRPLRSPLRHKKVMDDEDDWADRIQQSEAKSELRRLRKQVERMAEQLNVVLDTSTSTSHVSLSKSEYLRMPIGRNGTPTPSSSSYKSRLRNKADDGEPRDKGRKIVKKALSKKPSNSRKTAEDVKQVRMTHRKILKSPSRSHSRGKSSHKATAKQPAACSGLRSASPLRSVAVVDFERAAVRTVRAIDALKAKIADLKAANVYAWHSVEQSLASSHRPCSVCSPLRGGPPYSRPTSAQLLREEDTHPHYDRSGAHWRY